MASSGPIGTVSRAMAVLRVLAEAEGPVAVADVAAALDLPHSTTHRLLRLLVVEGMVDRGGGRRRYAIGVEYQRLSSLVVGRRGVPELARPFMAGMVEACEETCMLALYRPSDRDMTFVAQVESRQALRFHLPLHESLPVLWGCSGRVILAFLPEEEVAAVVAASGPAPVGGRVPPPVEALLGETLPAIRRRGWDTTRGEKVAHSVGVAAPVFAPDGVIGSLSVSVPEVRFDPGSVGALGELVAGAARSLSRALGARAT